MKKEEYPLVVPRLLFNRQANEALELYKKAFGATVKEKILFHEADPSDFQYKSKDDDNLVYYSELMIGNHLIMLHDDSYDMLDKEARGRASLTALCVSFNSEEKARDAYQIMSDGATIVKDMGTGTFYSFFVMLVDKFGIAWDLYYGAP